MAEKKEFCVKILKNLAIARKTWQMDLQAPKDVAGFAAGTFLHIKLPQDRFLLRRPISIFEVKDGIWSIIYKELGEGTKAMAKLSPGEVVNLLGPLGTGFPIQEDEGKVLLVGGGVGVPPLYELGKRLRAQGREVVSVLGFRDKESIFAQAEFESLGETYLCTDDGSCGFCGNVLAAILANKIDFDVLYACGPKVMLRALDQHFAGKKKGYLSLEERMACGIGACYGCMTKTKSGLKRVCKDGPVFALGEVDFND